jgi:hypothetical protein
VVAPLAAFGWMRYAGDAVPVAAATTTTSATASMSSLDSSATMAAVLAAPATVAITSDAGADEEARHPPGHASSAPARVPRARAVKKPDCASPFNVNADGIRVPRPERF